MAFPYKVILCGKVEITLNNNIYPLLKFSLCLVGQFHAVFDAIKRFSPGKMLLMLVEFNDVEIAIDVRAKTK